MNLLKVPVAYPGTQLEIYTFCTLICFYISRKGY